MKISISWLRYYVEFPSESELMQKLTSIGHMQDGPPEEIAGDRVYDLEVRQNRSDCLSILGIAREAAAVFNKPLKDPIPGLKPLLKISDKTTVRIEDPKLCYRFNTLTIDGIKVGESPQWLKDKLAAMGMNSHNNVVDVTNFVMFDFGQPLHAFDSSKIKNQTLVIRKAKKGESLKLLDESDLRLTFEDLIITDEEKPIALAGVKGGFETGITENTTSIILEAANYNQATVRRSSIRHQLRTEASTRLEKFLHPHLTELALERARDMILELCGGTVVDHTDEYPTKYNEPKVNLSIERLNSLGGVNLDQKKASEILKSLGITPPTIPFWRTDIQIEEDLIEEVLRIYGYENIVSTLPQTPPPASIDSKDFMLEEKIRDLMTAAGYDEQITDPLTKESSPKLEPVTLENSLNADKTMLRTTLKASLVQALENNKKYRKKQIKLFELGKIYQKPDREKKMLGFATTGVDYFDLKGIFDLLKEHFEIDQKEVEITAIDKETYFFEFPLEKIKSEKIIKPLYESPHVNFQDISLFVSKDVEVGELIDEVKTASTLLSKVSLGEDPQIKGDKKTVFLKLEFSGKNISKETVEPEKNKLIKMLQNKYKATLR